MDEKSKEVTKEESADTADAQTAEPVKEAPAEPLGDTVNEGTGEAVIEPTLKKQNKKLRHALVRVGAAFLAAVILLAVTSFSFIDLIKGAKESDAVQEEELGTFVKRDIFAIVGFFDAGADDSSTGEYALVPMSGKFVTVHFSKRYLESASTIESETYNYINGSVASLDSYVVAEGTTETLSDDLSTQMYDWFALNKDWMVEAGVIADTDDNATYLSDVVLEVDTVNGMSETLVYVLTGLAAVCLLYILVELVIMAAGVYLAEPRKKKAAKDAEETTEENDASEGSSENEDKPEKVSENAELTEDTSPEDGAECIKTDENPENNCCSENVKTETDIQEDKK